MSSAPLPTRLIFLSELKQQPPGAKVRFLGCVTKYSTTSGCVTLQHVFPESLAPPVIAVVDVNLLLSTLKSTDTQVGEWVNVIGYLESSNEDCDARRQQLHGESAQQQGGNEAARRTRVYRVQAVMLWSAGAVRIADYERAKSASSVEKK
ncbi:MAG: hypothetical protein LQ347_006539 [Umbilicaria vellea]|nr:MAG: hypothetical protein LQ347_006539 [Umbilicaria vellea]